LVKDHLVVRSCEMEATVKWYMLKSFKISCYWTTAQWVVAKMLEVFLSKHMLHIDSALWIIFVLDIWYMWAGRIWCLFCWAEVQGPSGHNAVYFHNRSSNCSQYFSFPRLPWNWVHWHLSLTISKSELPSVKFIMYTRKACCYTPGKPPLSMATWSYVCIVPPSSLLLTIV
jgi:hypothetical protein